MSDIIIETRQDEIHIEEVGVVFDAHMHIQSSHTCPLPLLWHQKFTGAQMLDVPISIRGLLDKFASLLTGSQAGGKIIGKGPGYLTFQENVIGRIVAEKNLITFSEMTASENKEKNGNCLYKSIFSPMVVLPMDMEYAHISGFKGFGGHTIYHEDETPWYYRHRIDVYNWIDPDRAIPIDEREGIKIHIAGESKGKKIKKDKNGKEEEEKLEIGLGTFKRKYVENLDNKKLYDSCFKIPFKYATLNDKQKKIIKRMKDEEWRLNYEGTVSIERSEMFVKWGNQLARTMQAALENPLHLIPMFHYEPRRWNGGKFNQKSSAHGPYDHPFQKKYIATHNKSKASQGCTVFAGIKMYPPLGYKPFDMRFGKKDNRGNYDGSRIDAFYQQCHANKVPVLAHCSPGGVVTHDSRKYMEFDKREEEILQFKNTGNANKEEYEVLDQQRKRLLEHIKSQSFGAIDDSTYMTLSFVEKKQADLRNKERDCYFANEYVHPKNWEPVVKKFKNINVCMAHFGGDEWITSYFCQPEETGIRSPWIKKTIELISSNKNAYTDISCFTLRFDKDKNLVKDSDIKKISFKMQFKEFLDGAIQGIYDGKQGDKCKVLDQILFGSDWYLTLNSYKESDYQPYIEEYKSFLDSVNKGLWIKFSMINPYYYYGFDQPGKIESLFKGLKKDKISKKNKKLLEDRRKILLGLTEGHKSSKNKMKNLEDMVKNEYKIETGRPYQ